MADGQMEEDPPCTCKPACTEGGHVCKGECGCEACRQAYSDFLSCDYE